MKTTMNDLKREIKDLQSDLKYAGNRFMLFCKLYDEEIKKFMTEAEYLNWSKYFAKRLMVEEAKQIMPEGSLRDFILESYKEDSND